MPTVTKTATIDATPLRTKHLAKQFGLKPVALRRILRSMTEYADGVHTNYRWSEKDPIIKKIEAAIKSRKEAADKAKAEAVAKLKAAKAAEAAEAPKTK